MDGYRLLGSFTPNWKGHLVISLLRSHGIDCFPLDENISSMFPASELSSLMGMRVMVASDSFQAAIDLLKKYEAQEKLHLLGGEDKTFSIDT